MTARRPPGRSAASAPASPAPSTSSSRLTAMRSAWKVRVGGWIRPASAPRAGDAAATTAARSAARHQATLRTRRQDRFRDATCMAFLTKRREDAGELSVRRAVDEVERGEAWFFIEPHVRRRIGREAEAPRRIGQLVAAEAQVEEDAVERDESLLARDVVEGCEVGLAQDGTLAVLRQHALRLRDGRPIGVEAKQATIRRRGLQQPIGVPSASDRAIRDGAARRRVERGENLVDQDRQVPFSHRFRTSMVGWRADRPGDA